MFYYVSNNDWSSSHSYQFWNKNFTAAASVNNTETVKTIYSPSPSGFVEPKTAAFTGFTSTGANSTTSSQFNVNGTYYIGWNFYTNSGNNSTIFFEAIGLRNTSDNSKGIVNYIGGLGYYWTVGASTTANALGLYFGGGHIYPQFSFCRSAGYSIRSVLN